MIHHFDTRASYMLAFFGVTYIIVIHHLEWPT